MNLVSCIAVYAALLREQGMPLKFPGTPGAFRAVYQVTDADLLSRAMVWAATTPACADQAYNITNGDFIRWENIWPRFARHFGMEVGPVQRVDLAQMMATQAPLWQRMVKKHRLQPIPFAQVAHWPFANYIFNMDWDMMSDTLKCRRDGFLEFKETEAMFLEQFDQLRRARVVP
jgi:nucleoside-diphosphate-sugar epimerase